MMKTGNQSIELKMISEAKVNKSKAFTTILAKYYYCISC